ncbi:hypothetical protein EDB87DRAFT_1690540 [Lactarius vividus]|nr:hypothetical protein EDB87DRAFT_1690540 [Lactarius vividus]
MSQSSPEDISITKAAISPGTGSLEDPPQRAPNQAPHGVSDLVDGSGLIFSMYLARAEEEDKKMAENWTADAEGTLVFTGLFSAVVASFISVSIQDIRPNPQDISNFYLANIYQTIANPNQSNISSFLPSSPPPFSPPNYAVWVNALWFMSLVISLTCALLATLLQQWARKYLRVTQPRYSSSLKRARIRTFFSEGVDGCLLPWMVEALPTLLHVSLFLFFAGLVIFLRSINLSIFKSVLSWVGVCISLYGCVTFMPVFRRDSPYHTPLSPLAQMISLIVVLWFGQWVFLFGAVFYYIYSLLRLETFSRKPLGDLAERIWESPMNLLKTGEEIALHSPSELDARAFMWTFDSLDEDQELEDFFSGLPGFRSSKIVKDPLPGLTSEQRQKLSRGLTELLDRTFSSDLVPEPVKKRRAMICAKATDPAHIPKTNDIFHKILSNYQYSCPLATDIVQIVRGWDSNMDKDATLYAQATISMIVARVQPRDDSWFILASKALGIEERDLQDYAANGDSLSLAILIHTTRQQFTNLLCNPWPYRWFADHVLKAASTFNVQDSSPELQHEFCTLWNQIVLKAQEIHLNRHAMAWQILRPIRNVYIALHRDTNSAPTQFSPSTGDGDSILLEPSSYPVCNVAGHIHDHSPTTPFVRAAALAPTSLANPDAPSSPIPSPLHVDESPTGVPLLEKFHCAHQTTTQILRNSVTSLDIATTSGIRDLVSSGRTILTPTTSTSAPFPPTPLPTVISLQCNSDPLTSSDPPNLSYPASPNPALVNIVPTDLPPLSPHSPITQRNLSTSCLQSHHSITVITVPSTTPGPISAEGGDSLKLSSLNGKDSLGSPSVDRAKHADTITAELDPPLQLPLVTDPGVATTTGRSLWESNSERTGDFPLHPLHCRYDMV